MSGLPRVSKLRDAWDRFWFAPASPTNLGFCRLLFYGGALIFTWWDFSALAEVGGVFWKPIWWIRLLGLAQPSHGILQASQEIFRLALAASCVGIFMNFMPTIWKPFFSKRVMISPHMPRCTASGLRMMSVRSIEVNLSESLGVRLYKTKV